MGTADLVGWVVVADGHCDFEGQARLWVRVVAGYKAVHSCPHCGVDQTTENHSNITALRSQVIAM